jgi:signal transduction histidine kinase
MPLSRPTVLILSTNPAFAREIAEHWPSSANPPEFTVLEQGLFREFVGGNYDLAIADATSSEHRRELRRALTAAAKPAVLIYSGRSIPFVPESEPEKTQSAVIELSQELGGEGMVGEKFWPVTAGLLGREILRRCQAEDRARRAEASCEEAQAQATLGRYISEMRHNINNALTSVLGNAELLTLEPGLPPPVLSQAETIRNMALRLHEVFRRFASIEEELSVAARQSGKEAARARSVASRK